jgi:steroid delta-isomerase
VTDRTTGPRPGPDPDRAGPGGRLATAVEAHVALFNECLRSGDWSPFLATFADDARMAFADAPVGPFVGREAIARAYAVQPPTDTMNLLGMEPVDADTARVRFAWDAGGAGTMLVRWRDDQVADLVISFD